jgi:pyruvate dehydrogenase E2 component (dihydrolipoamide acetyltransferase)
MNIIMPQLGETVAEGKIANWFKAVGDKVKAGENLFEIETDKVTMEVQATENGLLTEIRVAAGETVPVGTVVAVLGGADGKPAPAQKPTAKAAAPAAKPVAAPARGGEAPAPQAARRNGAAPSGTKAAPYVMQPFAELRTPTGQYIKANAVPDLKITPLARRLIKQSGIDIFAVAQGVRSRGGWRIAASDVTSAPAQALRAPEKTAAHPARGRYNRDPQPHPRPDRDSSCRILARDSACLPGGGNRFLGGGGGAGAGEGILCQAPWHGTDLPTLRCAGGVPGAGGVSAPQRVIRSRPADPP